MTGAQLVNKPRLWYFYTQTPEILLLKGTEEEFKAKAETTKTAGSARKRLAQRGREVALLANKLFGL